MLSRWRPVMRFDSENLYISRRLIHSSFPAMGTKLNRAGCDTPRLIVAKIAKHP
jgi:hypothetical protein